MSYKAEKVVPYSSTENKGAQVERMFDSIAENYDTLNHTMSMGIDIGWRKKGLSMLKKNNPQHILDIATGTGDLAIQAYDILSPQHILGIDISEGMMNVGRQKVAKAGSAGRGSRITSLILLVMSLALLSYPVVATVLADYNNSENARRYAEEITESTTPEMIQQLRSKAEDYNADLWATGHPVRQENPEDPAYQSYKEQLMKESIWITMIILF